jgi:hypothetical protein
VFLLGYINELLERQKGEEAERRVKTEGASIEKQREGEKKNNLQSILYCRKRGHQTYRFSKNS